MKAKEGFILRKIANTNMLIPIGKNIADFNGVISLNESAAFLWGKLMKGSELPVLAEDLVGEYSISKEQAFEDAEGFIKKLQEAHILAE